MKGHGKSANYAKASALAAGALALGAAVGAPAAQAGGTPRPLLPGWPGSTLTTDTDDPTQLTVPAGAVAVRVRAVGGRGEGPRGGVGAIVTGDIPVRAGQLLRLFPGRDGSEIRTSALIPPSTLGALGGSASFVTRCDDVVDCNNFSARALVAGAGGGSGGGSSPGLDAFVAPGGNAGEPGVDYSVARGFSGFRGLAATLTVPGAGGAGGAVPADCAPGLEGVAGSAGAPGATLYGGVGGAGFDASLTGGSGGGGYFGGGGGGGAATCGVEDGRPVADHGLPAGGGGGSNLVPEGGSATLNVDGRYSASQLAYGFITDTTAPTIDVSAPRDGERVAQGAAVTVRFTCADAVGIASCSGTTPDGGRIDTSRPSSATLTVTATDTVGNVTRKTIGWTVVAARASKLQASATRVSFALSGTAPVTLRIERRAAGGAKRWRQVGLVRRTAAEGTTTLRLNGKIAGRRLTTGRYRAIVKPANAAAVTRGFVVR